MLDCSIAPATSDKTLNEFGGNVALGPTNDESKVDSNNWTKWTKADTKSRILIVDDEPVVLAMVRRQLKDIGYRFIYTNSDATKTLSLLRELTPDVVLLDIVMPNMSGLEILKAMRSEEEFQRIPVIIMTASTERETKVLSLLGGALDFLRKPLDLTELYARVRNALTVKQHQDSLEDYAKLLEVQANDLEYQVQRRTMQLQESQSEAIRCLARAAEYRDDDTGQHTIRVGRYVAIIAEQLGYEASKIGNLEQAAQLHDVGKIGISDLILLKPGKLDDDEFEMVKKHCEYGEGILRQQESHSTFGNVNCPNPIFALAAVIASTHHERWDGTGYPNSLIGKEIPIEGRITAVADVYDALSSKRPYKEPFPHTKCVQILEEGRGSHFDPEIIDAFHRCSGRILEVRLKYGDS